MDKKKPNAIGRRDLLRAVASAGIATAALGASPAAEKPKSTDNRGKRRSQYQGNAPEVQTFYRVNAYPMK